MTRMEKTVLRIVCTYCTVRPLALALLFLVQHFRTCCTYVVLRSFSWNVEEFVVVLLTTVKARYCGQLY